MRLNESAVNNRSKIESYLRDRGCSIVKNDVQEGNYKADLIGYTVNESGSLTPQVIAEIKDHVNPNVQRQLFTYAKKFDTDYALLYITQGSETQFYWFDSKTSLPIPEPSFKSHSKFLLKQEDLDAHLFKYFATFEDFSHRSFDKIALLFEMLLVRSYLNTNNELDKWISMNDIEFYQYLEEAKNQYCIELVDIREKYDSTTLQALFQVLEDFPPFSSLYATVFLSLFERIGTREKGEFSTTKNLVLTQSKIINALGTKFNRVIDLASGFNFSLFSIYQKNTKNVFVGVEINKEIGNLSKVFNIICGYERITTLIDNSLELKFEDKYDLVTIDPPVGPFMTLPKYDNYYVVSASGRKRVDYSELFIEKSIEVAKEGGFIVAVVPEGILFSELSKPVRSLILEKTIVKAIISLPSHIRKPFSGIKQSILILQKKDNEIDGIDFFVGKIENLDEVDEVVEAFSNWISKEV